MSPSPSVPAQSSQLQQRVAGAFEELAESAAELNAVSDELTESIRAIEDALKQLNLGVSAWTRFAGSTDGTGSFWDRSVGYARVHRKWGLAIRTSSGHYDVPESISVEEWAFNDAPRSYRLEALKVLPDLLEKLARTSSEVAKELKRGVAWTNQVALTLGHMASSRTNRK